MADYVLDVGMEVHAELMTQSKMFCRDEALFGGEANTRTSPLSLGLPGTLPVPNRAAIEMVIRTALALNCQIAMHSIFHRKNYFYPDLPKGYQISQYGETNPLGYYGTLEIPTEDGGTKEIGIQRVHLEEDTGKLMHLPSGGSGVDYNRAGVPLMEIVTAFPPSIHTAEEAREYLVQLRQILLYLGVCDGKMEQGSLRCEPNISVRRADSEKLGTKTELKNLNSFRIVSMGVEYERQRQIEELERGGKILQETRAWSEQDEKTFVMRVKESEQDYRYFPDPDLVPMEFTPDYIEELRASLPELPLAKRRRYSRELGLSDYDANVLTTELPWATYFEKAVELGGEPKAICNWMNGDFARMLNETGQTALIGSESTDHEGREVSRIKPSHIVELTKLIEEGTISGKIAKDVFEEMFRTGEGARDVVKAKGLTQISDTGAIDAAVAEVLEANPGQVKTYLEGKEGLIGFFVGQVMKKTEGRANPQMVQDALKTAFEKLR